MKALKNRFHEQIRVLQDRITQKTREIDPELRVQEDLWRRKDFQGNEGGGGLTRAFSGIVFENAGVNSSLVFGSAEPGFLEKLGGTGELWAAGISLIIHPRNPRVPTVHCNFRMIEVGEKIWFGGGADLTPYYPYEEDFRHFHRVWARALEPYGLYGKMKEECDRYFVNSHRDNEMRGIGGIFFDYFNSGDLEKDFRMVVELSDCFIESYFPIVEKRFREPWTEEDEEFQLHRRGRYVEFNLLHDRGTSFGLQTNGRTDSILTSLPARCRFTYQYRPRDGSPQARMMQYYRPTEWLK